MSNQSITFVIILEDQMMDELARLNPGSLFPVSLTQLSSLQNHCLSGNLISEAENPLHLSAALFCLSLRKAVEEAMDPGLAAVTAYVSQDCTGMKDEAAVDQTGYWALCQNGPLFTSVVSVLLLKRARNFVYPPTFSLAQISEYFT